MLQIVEILAIACAHHENGQIQMTGKGGIRVSLLLSLPCSKSPLETHITATIPSKDTGQSFVQCQHAAFRDGLLSLLEALLRRACSAFALFYWFTEVRTFSWNFNDVTVT